MSFRLYFYFFNIFRCRLFRLGNLLGEFRSGKFLSVEGDFGYAHGGIVLTMSAQFFVLLFAFVVKDKDFLLAALFDHIAGHKGSGLWLADLAIAGRKRQHIAKLHLTVAASGLALHPNHIARRHPVLLPTGADDRVHALSPAVPAPPI